VLLQRHSRNRGKFRREVADTFCGPLAKMAVAQLKVKAGYKIILFQERW